MPRLSLDDGDEDDGGGGPHCPMVWYSVGGCVVEGGKGLRSNPGPGVPQLSGACLLTRLSSHPLIDTYNKVHVPRFHTGALELLS